jgi:hypothetical protein
MEKRNRIKAASLGATQEALQNKNEEYGIS